VNEKVAIVTGAARGIGRATADAMAAEGIRVVVADLLPEADSVADNICRNGGEAIAMRTDVSDAHDVERMVATAVQHFGRLDILHNNAGTTGQSAAPGPLAEVSVSDFDRVMRINLYGTFYGIKYAMPHLLAQGAGTILNTASIWGAVGAADFAAYSAAKHAVIGLTKSTAADYGRLGVRTNAIVPGPIQLDGSDPKEDPQLSSVVARTQVGRIGLPAEVAAAAIWLCSPASSYVNGACLVVDGGWLAW
jgi:NAD(P)-dependent dehydrogenase (short-subunit alcohol dehydrogenase family)